MISVEVKEIARHIGHFFLEKNGLDYAAACAEIEKLRINNISIYEKRTNGEITIEIETSRPGLVIGGRGEQIDKLSKYLEQFFMNQVKIRLVETKETILDFLLPVNYYSF